MGTLKEPSQRDGSFEHPKHIFILMDKKTITIFRSKSLRRGWGAQLSEKTRTFFFFFLFLNLLFPGDPDANFYRNL